MVVVFRHKLKTVPLLIAGLVFLSACRSIPAGSGTTTLSVPPKSQEARGIIVVIHGANGTAERWPRDVEDRIREIRNRGDWDIFRVNWPEISDRVFLAPGRGRELGRRFGEQLATAPTQYEVIHLVASSMGAHVAHGLAERYREIRATTADSAYIHTTFLDPFAAAGLFRMRYGVRNFGRHADFAENYYTADDPVPFTNRPLRHAANFDLSGLIPPRENPGFTYFHDFPVYFYRDSVGAGVLGFFLSPFAQGVFLPESHYRPRNMERRLPPGTVIEVGNREESAFDPPAAD